MQRESLQLSPPCKLGFCFPTAPHAFPQAWDIKWAGFPSNCFVLVGQWILDTAYKPSELGYSDFAYIDCSTVALLALSQTSRNQDSQQKSLLFCWHRKFLRQKRPSGYPVNILGCTVLQEPAEMRMVVLGWGLSNSCHTTTGLGSINTFPGG